jgi:cysteine desulfurase family protein
MRQRRRVYLDNAATSWPKPQAVYDAVNDYQRRLGAAFGRGGYGEAEEVRQEIERTRSAVARLIGAESSEQVVFTFNGTDSLNLAIRGILNAGDHVISTVVEHNSVLRPLRWLEKKQRIEVTYVGCDAAGVVDPKHIRAALRPHTKLIIVTHASNVTGSIQLAPEIGQIAREHNILFLVDAAQTLGHLPVSVLELGADLLAAPGHKGLLGPLGTGILYLRPGVERLVECVRQGGTGSSSSSIEQPDSLPEKYESGNHNVPGIVGLGAGVTYIQGRGIENIRQHEIQLTNLLLNGLAGIPGIEIFGPGAAEARVGVVSFSLPNPDAPIVAKRLEDAFGIQVRAGFHCAALMHRALGTLDRNGTVRLSIGPLNTADDIAIAIKGVTEVAESRVESVAAVSCPCTGNGKPAAQHYAVVTPAHQDLGGAFRSSQATEISTIPGLSDLWNETLGDPRVCIAVLDGSVDLSHPCFRGAKIALHPSAVSAVVDKGAATQHGTHVASVIFGQHGSPIKGIAPRCRGLVIPVFRDGPDGSVVPCSQVDLARAITLAVQYATEQGVSALVINISGGQFSPSGEAHPLLNDVVENLNPEIHLIVAAAGNQGCDCLHIPGAIPSVLAVGAMNGEGTPLPFSNWGKAYQAKGLLALGENILGASAGQGTDVRTGTSYATPVVSGIAALLLSLQLMRSGTVSATRIRSGMLRTARDCETEPIADCRKLLAGRLDIPAAVLTLFNKGPIHMTNDLQIETSAADAVIAQDCDRAAAPGCDTRSDSAVAAVPKVAAGIAACSACETRDRDAAVTPAGCGCGSPANTGGMQKVYAIGKLSFDYGTRQRRDYFRNAMGGDPDNDANLYKYLTARPVAVGQDMPQYLILNGPRFANRTDVTALIWILKINDTPIYAISPQGPFASEIHDTLVAFLRSQLPRVPTDGNGNDVSEMDVPYGEEVERMALPGVIAGETRLFTGERVPVVVPDPRGLANWTTDELVNAIQKMMPATSDAQSKVADVLNRLYELTRNLGITSRDRALNYAATDALALQGVLSDPRNHSRFAGLELDTIDVNPSPICRPDYDCWDVVISFYNPKILTEARQGIRYTIDVSDVLPQIIAASTRVFSIR